MSRGGDMAALLRGMQKVAEAGYKLQETELKNVWRTSSVKKAIQEFPNKINSNITNKNNFEDIAKNVTDGFGKLSTIPASINELGKYKLTKPEEIIVPENQRGYNIYSKLSESTSIKEESKYTKVEDIETKSSIKPNKTPFKIKLTQSDKELLKKLDREHREKMAKQLKENESKVNVENEAKEESQPKITVKPHPKSTLKISESAKQRTVPSSRIGRMVSFGGLAAGLGIGTLSEYAKRTLGFKDEDDSANLFMSKANIDRIVDTLCKVRGAALKIGQILSIQDESIISPEIAKAFERVRKSADFMPTWQLEKVLVGELGSDWRQKFLEFDDKPFAAASIGQVHLGRLHDGREVAVKIQYPGVAKSIESDIDNLVGIMKVWNIFPPGMFVDNVVTVAKRELAWEVDYIREAECTKTFKEILKPYPYYYVPNVIDSVSSKQVFTTELLDGIPVDKCVDLSFDERKYIASRILELVLREVMEFRYMQTDPNWANFFYNTTTKKVLLLDFGASREYSKKFVDNYVRIIRAAADGDRNTILTYSRELGFFTGYESKLMEEAHIEAVMVLGEVFRCPGEFDFSHQKTTEKIQQLVPTMLAHRLCPPPEEIYSLHRKISGVFLLCAKLKVPVNARRIFNEIYDNYNFEY